MTSAKFSRLFWGATVLAVVGALVTFSVIFSGGRVTGPSLFLAAAVGAIAVVGRLLVEAARALVQTGEGAEEREARAAVGRRRKELEREYHNLKRALKELELDHSMGKVSEDDYTEIRARYRERAVRILRQLDQGQSYRAQIDADLRARRKARGLPERGTASPAPARKPAEAASKPEPKPEPETRPEPEPAALPAAETAAPALPAPAIPAPAISAPVISAPAPTVTPGPGPCASCGASNDEDARFCKKCGARLAGTEAITQ